MVPMKKLVDSRTHAPKPAPARSRHARTGHGPSMGPPTPSSRRVRAFDLDLGAIWQRRELLYFLVWRDVKVRYKQTVIGAAWACSARC